MPTPIISNCVELTFQQGASEKVVKIEGLKSLKGNNYLKFNYGGHVGYVGQDYFVARKQEARIHLQTQRVMITSNSHWSEILNGIEGIDFFAPAPLIEGPGWTRSYFAEKGGVVHTPKGHPRGIPIYPRSSARATVKGSFAAWKREVAGPLTGQNLPMLAVMAAFAAPLLAISGESQNIGIEFCGRPAKGKTTCLKVMASVAGNPDLLPNFNATQLGIESMFADHNDLPFPVDEVNLVSHGGKDFLRQFAFRMANGTARVTAFQLSHAQYRFVFATTSNRPFHEALRGFDTDTADAALQRLLSLKVPEDNAFGVFDGLPVGFASSGALATHIGLAITSNYGRPMRRFLRALVNARADASGNFQAKLLEKVHEFEAAVGVTGSQQGKTRASTAFGLLYAAGAFAKWKGILPTEWDCLAACVAGYRNYQAQLPHHTPIATRLLTIAQREATLDLRNIDLPRLTTAQIEGHGAFLKLGVRGRLELLITDAIRRQFFPDWSTLQHTDAFKLTNLRDAEHATKQRQVRRGRKKERFYCFVLPTSGSLGGSVNV